MRTTNLSLAHLLCLLIGVTLMVSGCASKYVTPGGPADFVALGITRAQADAMTDAEIFQKLSRKPAAGFPASVAVVRVQGPGYSNHTAHGFGDGRYTILTARDVESTAATDRLQQLPMIRGIAMVNRLTAPAQVNSEMGLRTAAADLQADILLLYTFDTVFGTETTIPAMGVITLGLFPNERARVSSTVSAAFIDVRTGYIYGTCEATERTSKITNAWNTEDAVDSTRKQCESKAFDALVGQIEETWKGIVKTYTTSPDK